MTSNSRSFFKGARYEIAITRLSETILVTVTLNILDTCSIFSWGTARMQLSLVSAISAIPGKIHRDHHLNPRARCPLGIAKSIRRPMAAEKFRIAACSTAGLTNGVSRALARGDEGVIMRSFTARLLAESHSGRSYTTAFTAPSGLVLQCGRRHARLHDRTANGVIRCVGNLVIFRRRTNGAAVLRSCRGRRALRSARDAELPVCFYSGLSKLRPVVYHNTVACTRGC